MKKSEMTFTNMKNDLKKTCRFVNGKRGLWFMLESRSFLRFYLFNIKSHLAS